MPTNVGEWRNAPASRELDAVVAEHVMGWGWMTHDQPQVLPRARWLAPPHQVGDFGHVRPADGDEPPEAPWWLDETHRLPAEMERVPHYSTDIAAAWALCEALVARGFGVSVANVRERQWRCEIDRASWTGSEVWSADTAALAICRAALAVVDSEEG